MVLEDGTPSKWARKGAVEEMIARCPTDEEVKRRIHGEFTKRENMIFPSLLFREKNVIAPHVFTLKVGKLLLELM